MFTQSVSGMNENKKFTYFSLLTAELPPEQARCYIISTEMEEEEVTPKQVI